MLVRIGAVGGLGFCVSVLGAGIWGQVMKNIFIRS